MDEFDMITEEILGRVRAMGANLGEKSGKEVVFKKRVAKPSTRNKQRRKKLGKNNPNYGKARSDATKQKISNAMKGRKLSPRHKKRISEGVKENWVVRNRRV